MAGSVLVFAGFFALSLGVLGCEKKDDAKCEQGLSVARQAAVSGDSSLTRQWREYAFKHCKDELALKALDQEIIRSEARVEERRRELRAKQDETKQLLALFVKWVSEHRAAPDGASQTNDCQSAGIDAGTAKTGQPSKERWCSAARAAGDKYQLRVKWWDAARDSARFWVRPVLATTCSDLGQHNSLRTWEVPALGGKTVKRWHCELTGGSLAGMHALVTAAPNSDVQVFSAKYLEKDPTFLR